MKLALNLAIERGAHDRYAFVVAGPLAGIALAVLVLLGHSAAREWQSYQRIRTSLEPLQATAMELRERENALRRELERPEPREVYRRVRMVNGLFDRRRLSLTELTDEISRLLPDQVRLTSLTLAESSELPTVRLGFEAATETAMEEFLVRLEDSPRFSDIAILNQGFSGEASDENSIRVSCVARYHLRDVAGEKR